MEAFLVITSQFVLLIVAPNSLTTESSQLPGRFTTVSPVLPSILHVVVQAELIYGCD